MRRPYIFIRPEVYCVICVCLLLLPFKLMLAWLTSVTVHELFHFAAIKLSGGQVGVVQIGADGVKMQTSSMTHWQELLCAAAGPIGSLLLFVLFLKKIPMLAVFGLLHCLYNLIPLYPLDGGRILHSLIGVLFRGSAYDKIVNATDASLSMLLIVGVVFMTVRFAVGPVPLVLLLCMIFHNKKAKPS